MNRTISQCISWRVFFAPGILYRVSNASLRADLHRKNILGIPSASCKSSIACFSTAWAFLNSHKQILCVKIHDRPCKAACVHESGPSLFHIVSRVIEILFSIHGCVNFFKEQNTHRFFCYTLLKSVLSTKILWIFV